MPEGMPGISISQAHLASARAPHCRAGGATAPPVSVVSYPCIQLSKIVAKDAFHIQRVNLSRSSDGPGPAPPYGGDDRDRTDDLRLAKPALSQLSYIPVGNAPLGARR
jgi:hypothetical protein